MVIKYIINLSPEKATNFPTKVFGFDDALIRTKWTTIVINVTKGIRI